MKRVLVGFTLFLLALTVTASAQDTHETLFASPVQHGGFGGVVTKMTAIQGEMGLMVGGYGGWLIDHRLMIGGGGYGLASSIRARGEAEEAYAMNGERLYVEFGYGGVMLEYILAPHRLVHVNVQALVGAGGVNYREDWYDDFLDDNADHHRHGRTEALFVVEPAVNVELNLTEWMRLSAGASYRFVNGIDELRGIEDKDLSGASGQLSLKFGAF